MSKIAVRNDDFFSGVVSKSLSDISRPQMVKALLRYNDLSGESIRSVDNKWIEYIASLLPFSNIVAMQMKYGEYDPLLLANKFLRETFAHLDRFGVSYDVDLNPDNRGKSKIDELVKASKKAKLTGQANGFEKEYNRLYGLRRMFALMHDKGLLVSPDFVIPMDHFAETFLAEPVLFTSMSDSQEGRLKRFGSLFRTTEQTDLYQIYNYNLRTFASFNGLGETVPMNIMEVMGESLEVFDYLVIMTPYHDLAEQMWQKPVISTRPFDPEIFGVMEGKPYLIRLGRWSGTGFLAGKCDQIAATVMHLWKNLGAVENFLKSISSHYGLWYKGVWCSYRNRHELYPEISIRPLKAAMGIVNQFSPPHIQSSLGQKHPVERNRGFLEIFSSLFRF